MQTLENRVAIVTGGARGIGRSIVSTLAREGARVIVADIGKVLETDGKAKDAGGGLLVFEIDVTRKNQVDRMIEKVLRKFKRIDILVNNAGICETTPLEDLTEEQWDRMMEINLKSAFLCSQAVLSVMKRQRFGRIINISSIAAKTGGLLVGTHYAVSKAGLICLTKCLAKTLAPHGINVNAIAPGITETKMMEKFSPEQIEDVRKGIPLLRLGTPEDIAEMVTFLASEKAGFITGETININGGSLME